MSNALLAPAAAPPSTARTARRVRVLAECAAGVAAAVVVASLVVVAIAHLHDRYHLNFVSAVFAGLSARLNDGTLYPPLFDGEHYGGTRYMLLSFVPQAALARLTGELILSGKGWTLALSAILFLQLFQIVRGFGCGRGASLALASLPFLTNAGILAATTIRGDLLPVVLQLAALQVARVGKSPAAVALAGFLCTLALLTKITAAWAPLVIAGGLLIRDRRAAVVFLAIWLGTLAAALGGLHFATAGRMLDNFRAVSVGGVQFASALKAPVAMFARLGQGGGAEALLIPLAAVSCATAFLWKRVTRYHAAFLASVPITLAIFTDVGADYNHLLDLLVLAVPVAGSLWATAAVAGRSADGLRAGLAAAACWALFMGWTGHLGRPLHDVFTNRHTVSAPFPPKPLAGLVADDAVILSEDPWVSLARGRTPIILDPCALACLTRTRADLTGELVHRIEQGGFDRVVLRRHGGDADAREEGEWEDRAMGRPVIEAIYAHYRVVAVAEGFIVYAPRDRVDGTEIRQAAR
jgi:hypothetical protein